MFVWKSKYDNAMKANRALVDRLDASLTSKDETIERLVVERDKERETAAWNLARNVALQGQLFDALAELAPLKAAREKADANLRRANEARRQKREAAATAQLPEGLYQKSGVIGFDCHTCDAFTHWDGDASDFEFGDPHNVCGGSPRCCP